MHHLLPPGVLNEEATLLAELPDSARLRQLVDDVEVIIFRDGFLHLTMDDIAAEVRCSKTTLYRLAPRRERLFELAVKRWLARVRDGGWRGFLTGDGWPEKLELYCRAAVTAIEEDSLGIDFWRDLEKFPIGYRALMSHQAMRADGLDYIIRLGTEAGAFVDVPTKLVSRLMISSFREIVRPDLMTSVGVSVGDAVREWYRILEFGLVKRPTPGRDDG